MAPLASRKRERATACGLVELNLFLLIRATQQKALASSTRCRALIYPLDRILKSAGNMTTGKGHSGLVNKGFRAVAAFIAIWCHFHLR